MTASVAGTSGANIWEDYGLRPPPAADTGLNKEMGQEDFLTLLTTQMQYQDPFNPMENTEMVAQLAQFSSLEGITTLNETFEGVAKALTSNQVLQAAVLVGKSTLAKADTAPLQLNPGVDGNPVPVPVQGAVELDAAASDLRISVFSSNGELVQVINLGTQAAGMVDFQWDGTSYTGELMPPGSYRFAASSGQGESVTSHEVLLQSRIDSVSLGKTGSVALQLENGSSLDVNDVTRIIN